jgi:hypothetical protein
MARRKKEVTPEVEKQVEKQEEVKKEFNSQVFAKAIIEKSRITDFIEVNFIDNPTHRYEYVDWDDKTEHTLKGLEQFIQVGEFQVAVHVTQDQIQSLEGDWGIDVKAMIQSVMVNEAATSMAKHTMARIGKIARENYIAAYTTTDKLKAKAYEFANKFRFKKSPFGERIKVEYKKKIKVDNVKDLLKAILAESNKILKDSKLSYGNFAVCSIKTGTILQMASEFAMAPIPGDGTFSSSYGMPYAIGKIAGMTIYVDPYMLYADTNVYIGCKTQYKYPGIKLFMYDYGVTEEMVTTGVGAPKMRLKVRYALVECGKTAQSLYRKIEYQDDPKKSLI